GVADRHDGVHQAELRHRWIAKGDVESEDGREVRDRLLEVAGGDHHLPETHGRDLRPSGFDSPGWWPDGVRLSCHPRVRRREPREHGRGAPSEPMIWLISLICVTELTGILRRPRLLAR